MEGIHEDANYSVVFITTTPNLSSPSSSPIYSGNFSLAEHSYCASLSSVSNHPQEEVSDIFEINDGDGGNDNHLTSGGGDLIPSKEFPVEFGEDVNFDGYNFSIPLKDGEGCGGELMELGGGFQWGNKTDISSGRDLGGMSTVEVTSSSKVNESENCGEVSRGDGGRGTMVEAVGQQKERNANEKKNKQCKTKLSKKSKPRRRDYIEDPREREKFFEHILKRLALSLHRTMCRTGCEGEISAKFEGKVFNANPASNRRSKSNDGTDSDNQRNVTPSILYTSGADRSGIDDHRYAATMLTQNVLSSTVWDHQYAYDEAIAAPDQELGQDFDEDCEIIEEVDVGVSQKKRVKRFDYIQHSCAREQTLCKLAKSLFWQKIRMEQRTGAKITLTLKYGSCDINDMNYQDCAKLIASSKRRGKVIAPLAPKPSSAMPLTFIIPSNHHPVRIPVSLPLSEIGPPPINATAPLYQLLTADNVILPIYPDDNEIPQQNQNFSAENQNYSIQEDSNEIHHSGDPPVFELTYSNDTNFINHESPQQQIVTTSSVGANEMTDSSTNTEPICSICKNEGIHSACGTVSKAKTSFWIRCNDPFCYDMVHPSCVGFMVTHAAHLRQLPPFYCKLHR